MEHTCTATKRPAISLSIELADWQRRNTAIKDKSTTQQKTVTHTPQDPLAACATSMLLMHANFM
jgi:hypothetical protein